MTVLAFWLMATARFVMATGEFWFKMPTAMEFVMQTKLPDVRMLMLAITMLQRRTKTVHVSWPMATAKFVTATVV
jgi:hypothetical protein